MTNQEIKKMAKDYWLPGKRNNDPSFDEVGFARAILSRAIPEGHVVVPGWLPIESAPKDGTTILVFFRQHGWMSVEWNDIDQGPDSEFAHWHVTDHKFGPFPVRGYCDGDDLAWMPLPAAPAPEGEA